MVFTYKTVFDSSNSTPLFPAKLRFRKPPRKTFGFAEGNFSQASLQNLWFCEARKIYDFAWVS